MATTLPSAFTAVEVHAVGGDVQFATGKRQLQPDIARLDVADLELADMDDAAQVEPLQRRQVDAALLARLTAIAACLRLACFGGLRGRQVFVDIQAVDVEIEAERQRRESGDIELEGDVGFVEAGRQRALRRLLRQRCLQPAIDGQPERLHRHFRACDIDSTADLLDGQGPRLVAGERDPGHFQPERDAVGVARALQAELQPVDVIALPSRIADDATRAEIQPGNGRRASALLVAPGQVRIGNPDGGDVDLHWRRRGLARSGRLRSSAFLLRQVVDVEAAVLALDQGDPCAVELDLPDHDLLRQQRQQCDGDAGAVDGNELGVAAELRQRCLADADADVGPEGQRQLAVDLQRALRLLMHHAGQLGLDARSIEADEQEGGQP
jgi:hypothetical protein